MKTKNKELLADFIEYIVNNHTDDDNILTIFDDENTYNPEEIVEEFIQHLKKSKEISNVQAAIDRLEYGFPIQNGEGYDGYLVYFKKTDIKIKELSQLYIFENCDEMEKAFSLLENDKYYKLNSSNEFESFIEISKNDILDHIKEYTDNNENSIEHFLWGY